MVGRKERILHQELCKRVKDDLVGFLKPWISDISSTLKDSVNQLSVEALHRVVPFYGLLSEEYTSHMLQDAYVTVKKAQKYLQDKATSEGDIVSCEKLHDWLKTNADLKTLSQDHVEVLKTRYLETKKAVKPLTIYFNLKKLLDDVQDSSQKQLVKQTSASNMSNKTPTPVQKKVAVPPQKKPAAPASQKETKKEPKKEPA